ncbi:Kelch repeat-containing protein 3 [Rhizina undulata]
MGKKDKSKKSADKKTRVAEKTAKKTAQKEKKLGKKGPKGALEDDEEDVDLDQVLEEYARQQALFLKVTETPLSEPPPPRANATLTPSPASSTDLFLFGGETFNGTIAHFFNDLFVYNVTTTSWRHITSPNSPLPRSGHWVTSTPHSGGSLWLFGGEFSSPKQGTFYHYNDFWRFDCGSREWTRVETKKGPPARSGHRMVAWKNYVILMNGFQDTSASTKYLSDLWVFDTSLYTWTQINLPAHAQRPDARSSFSLLPHEQGAVIYGGYSRVKSSSAPSVGRKGQKAVGGGSVLKPVMHQDTWLLRMDVDLSKVRWERRKKPVNSPNPPRVGVTMAYHKGRGIMFGGVKDEEESEEGLESVFFDELFAWGIDRNRFFPLVLRKPRAQKKVVNERGGGGRRDRAKEDEEELLRNLAVLEAAASGEKIEDVKPKEEEEKVEESKPPQQELSLQLPHARFNTAMAVQDDVLYIYGGTFEKGDREYTFDEMYSIDLGKLDGVRTIFSRADETQWEVSEDEDEDEEDEDDDEEEDEEEEGEAKDDGGKPDEAEIEERRKEKALRKQKIEEPDTPATSVYDGPDEAEAALDTTPHPRPFESLKDFYARTSTAWQELLIAQQNEAAAGQKATKTIKELRKEAFAFAEDKWWACREEIRALEDEQEEAGIGEVISLGDVAAGAGTGGAGRRR